MRATARVAPMRSPPAPACSARLSPLALRRSDRTRIAAARDGRTDRVARTGSHGWGRLDWVVRIGDRSDRVALDRALMTTSVLKLQLTPLKPEIEFLFLLFISISKRILDFSKLLQLQ